MATFDGLAVEVRETRHKPATGVQGSSRGAMDWNDVRVFLAVAREGSMRAAGFLARCLSEATATALPPGITLELVDELRQTANLVRRQADMALRHEPPEGGDFYISDGCLARLGQPDGISRSRMAEMLEVDKAGPRVRC